ncbi:glycogen synthase GlgA [Gracilibacillus sp. YIM 98692]|uniref:glycogen synthase GlgA n=1 Tax=Gracilibacillus sp. YIM 98692 TaxID=2663532 RepID=UPI0013D12262|nr:glycogen synthase GlgA [Gracilibacillus sp. YIM 98692]
MKKNILFVASECSPFIKTGGLADVVGSLPQALKKNGKGDIRVCLPLYQDIPKTWRNQMEVVTTLDVEVGWRTHQATFYQLSYKGLTYYFVANDYYFSRNGIYGYEDDGERFLFFSQAVIEALFLIDFKPDILHAHDWQAGLAVALAKIYQPVQDMKTIFTIHNLKYQGIMQKDAFEDLFNIPPDHIAGLEWHGLLNSLKAALFHADKITTVSPTYADEIKTPYYGEGLHPFLSERSDDLVGILNGLDMEAYNPKTDPNLFTNYSYSRKKKQENKLQLQEQFGLTIDQDIPLYVIVTRLVEQKGLHLIQAILDEFLQENVQFILLGTGDYEFEHFFYHAAERHSEKMAAYLSFDEALARQLYAASDFFLMPSLFEPCGLAQLIALQYKSVPVVRETGGLKDTVTPFDEYNDTGNGFSFTNYNAHDLLNVLRYSLSIYNDKNKWTTLFKNIKKSNFSWKDSAKAYDSLYSSLLTSEMQHA